MKRNGNAWYFSNQGALRSDAFAELPLGAVRADGFLREQLVRLKDGLTGAMESYPDYNETSGWRGGDGEDWERGPYYLRGLVALAYALDDDALKQKAQTWIEWILQSGRPDGFFGPQSNPDWWPRMPVLMTLRDYYLATEDPRILPFMTAYFRYQLKTLPGRPLDSWARARGGDNIDSVYWLYNRLYDSDKPEATAWLLELAALLRAQTMDWTRIFTETTAREHVVNTSQALKMPVVCYQGSHDPADRDALKKGLSHIRIDHGRIDGLPNADEAARDNKSTRGTELCGIVEGMLSAEIAVRILGEGWLGDWLERLAYNALPSGYAYDYKSHVYYILQNQVLATRGNHGFDCDHGDSSAFSAPCGFDCCFANNHMGWPKFVQSMWMATAQNGLAAIAYGPNTVRARVADGKTATFTEQTDYPFDDRIYLRYTGESAAFELKLRVPAWCKSPELRVNGEKQPALPEQGFLTLTRPWQDGDTVELVLPAAVKTSSWYNNAVAVERGALIYALPIEEDWRDASGDDALRELKVPLSGGLKNREVFPKSRWNYGLAPDAAFTVERQPVAGHPFCPDGAPIRLKTIGQRVPDWKLDGNLAGEQPFFTPPDARLTAELTLIPYGCTRLKITHFPRIAPPAETVVLRDPEVCGNRYLFQNVVVPYAAAYDLRLLCVGRGSVTVTVNDRARLTVQAAEDTIVSDLGAGIQPDAMRFGGGQYNRIELETDLPVNGIEILPRPYTLSVTASTAFETICLRFTRIPDATHYEIEYQTDDASARIGPVFPNPYKAGGCFDAEQTAFTVPAGKTYRVRVAAYTGGTPICTSQTLSVTL